jgi:hypothetical protein
MGIYVPLQWEADNRSEYLLQLSKASIKSSSTLKVPTVVMEEVSHYLKTDIRQDSPERRVEEGERKSFVDVPL